MTTHVGFLIYEDVQEMDFVGPWEIISMWRNALGASLEMYLISERGGMTRCVDGMLVKADRDFSTAPKLDFLFVPGGKGRLQEVHNRRTIEFIKLQAEHCRYVLSVCTGAFLLEQAGLLHNKKATTYWRALPELEKCKGVEVDEKRYTKSGHIWTGAGVTSGIDLALALIADVAGKATAGKVQLLCEYFPQPTDYVTKDLYKELPEYHSSGRSRLPKYIEEELGD